jgi:hypothetical protein
MKVSLFALVAAAFGGLAVASDRVDGYLNTDCSGTPAQTHSLP